MFKLTRQSEKQSRGPGSSRGWPGCSQWTGGWGRRFLGSDDWKIISISWSYFHKNFKRLHLIKKAKGYIFLDRIHFFCLSGAPWKISFNYIWIFHCTFLWWGTHWGWCMCHRRGSGSSSHGTGRSGRHRRWCKQSVGVIQTIYQDHNELQMSLDFVLMSID